MPDVNYLVSSLPDYVEQNREVLVDAIQFGTPTIKRITLQTGIKTTGAVNFLGVNVPLQDGKGCCIEPDGEAGLTQRIITTAMIAKVLDICPDTLLGKWPEYLVRVPADDRQNLPFEAYLLAAIISETQDQLEVLIWQGDTGNGDLIDGFLTILAGEADVVPVTINAGTSAYGAVASVIAAIPAKVLGQSPKVFVAPELFVQLSLELVEKNLFHFAPDGNMETLVFPGTRIEVINTPGLTGTDCIVASPLNNMFYGTDVEDAERRFKVIYDEKCDNFRIKFRWNSGVQVAFPARVVVGAIGGALVSPDANAALNAIAGSVAELADADHIFKTDEQA